MATTPDADLVTYLSANHASFTADTNLFKGPVRVEGAGVPAEAAFALSSGGPPPEPFVAGGTGDEQRYSLVTIRIRSNPHDFEGGQTLARAARDTLHHATVSGYINVEARETDPVYLGPTEKGHHEWSVEIMMEHLE